MLRKAGQTARPIGLKFFVDTQGWQGGVIGSTKFKNKKNKIPRATPGHSTS